MNTAASKNFLIILSSLDTRLQQLINQAELSYHLKDIAGQKNIGTLLRAFPALEPIGNYYEGVAAIRHSLDTAQHILESVTETAPRLYRAKALNALGGIAELRGETAESFKLREEAIRLGYPLVTLEAKSGMAVLKSIEGSHNHALLQLEAIIPLAEKLGARPLYFDVLNSYAVELAEIGKPKEAVQVITPVIMSPYTRFHPNWLETAQEIREKSGRRSMVTFNKSNLIEFPSKIDSTGKEEPGELPEEEPRYTYENYLVEEFNLRDKVEDWVYGDMKPDDFGTLMVALSESDDNIEQSMIIEHVIDATFVHTDEAKEAKEKWRNKLCSRMK